ncbi:RsmB/NOP family class I SAM-dependent RNA methyltransferase [Paracoccus mutanolyticus]|uniref:RsmB/NOP family class I SAM-dependent RNA methyltransferase n=1 Tax=Paracoccus mutanolyticus TaxID=1499308 RepID=UPI00294FF203|nr:RsmB/NOP family class I SAM-dependent RNA methyltransferase [Paracoccus mutanolyticus]
MTPAARAEAAITILDRILAGDPAEPALLRWSRASRMRLGRPGRGARPGLRCAAPQALARGAGWGDDRARADPGDVPRPRAGPRCPVHRRRPCPGAPDGRGTGRGPPPDPGRGARPARLAAAPRDASLGARAEAVAQAMRARAPVWLRANTLRASPQQAVAALAEEGIATEAAATLPTALRVIDGARRIAGSRAYREGLVELQDLSPQRACAVLPLEGSVLDYCSGGGGKALALAARGARAVTAHDVDAARMADLPARAARPGRASASPRPEGSAGTSTWWWPTCPVPAAAPGGARPTPNGG